MKTVAVICEYNPFHLGHVYHLNEIKRTYGEDTAIVAIMSGNFVQRGECAMLGKFERARMAVEAGASLVLELPFPYSSASAEHFAMAGVYIANALGIVDVLSFGSECGDADHLYAICKRLSSKEFQTALSLKIKEKSSAELGFATLRSNVYRELYGEDELSLLCSPNNILAISYIQALSSLGSRIDVHTVKRYGTDEDGAREGVIHAGATYIRKLFKENQIQSALSLLPEETHSTWRRVLGAGQAPVWTERLAPALLSKLRLATASGDRVMYAECGGGLYHRMLRAAGEVGNLDGWYAAVRTKKYTDARIRRALLYSFFEVSAAALQAPPAYTQILAMDAKGRAALRSIKKNGTISVLTKPADIQKLSPAGRAQAELVYRADSVYALAMPTPAAANAFLSVSPFCE